MKKLISLIAAILLLAGCSDTNDGPTELKRVLDSREEYFTDEDGNTYYELWEDYAYDVFGHLARVESRVNDEPSLRTVYRYDEAGLETSHTQYDLSGWFPRLMLHVNYSYDDQGRPTGMVQWSGLERTEETNTYDDENHTVTQTFHGCTTVVHQDEQGRTLRTETTFADGSTAAMEYEYGQGSKIIREFVGGEPGTVWEYTYDEQGRELEWYETKDGDRQMIWRYEYGEDYDTCYYEAIGRIITTGYNDDGTVKAIVETDESGRVTRHVIYRYTEIRVPAEGGETS